jgi:hypothetical protein
VKEWKTIYKPSESWKEARVGIVLLNKGDFKIRSNKEGHYIVGKRTIH